MPAPLTPSDCDLRDFHYMPVDIARLLGSEFHAFSSDAGWRAGMTLWLRSYHQVPAASLPDDDVALARLAEYGRDTKAWLKVREEALRGWVKCDDGRLYHRVVAEKALEAWIEKLVQRRASGAGNARRWGGNFDSVALEDAIGIASRMLASINPQSRILTKRSRRNAAGTPTGTLTGNATGTPTGNATGSPGRRKSESQGKGREERTPSQEEQNSDLDTGEGRALYPGNGSATG